MSEPNVTTEEHFKAFQEEALRWIEFFGLKGWQVDFRHADLEKNRADISYGLGSRIAAITLSTNWSHDPVTEEKVRRSAFHEVCELLLGRLSIFAKERFNVEEFQIDEEVHALIRTFENVIFQPKQR